MNSFIDNRKVTPQQLKTVQTIPEPDAHIEPYVAYLPAKKYIDPEYFEREKATLFATCPVVIAASVDLPEPGSYRRQDMLGVSVLLTRKDDGSVSAFLNVCTHRGTLLCPTNELKKGRLVVCPYHAWSFKLNGDLAAVPRQAMFKDLDKADYPLVELPCQEVGGLIWLGLDRHKFAGFTNVTDALEEELGVLRMSDMYLYRKSSYEIAANWKLVMDSMLDTYHVTRLHKNTLAKFFVDAPTNMLLLGEHQLNVARRKNLDKDKLSDDLATVRTMAVFTFNLFPNAIVVLSPDYVSIAILRPVKYNKTTVDYYMLSNTEPTSDNEEQKLNKSFALMDSAFGQEDFWAATLGQEGLESGAIERVTLSAMESQMKHFHDVVDKYVD